MSDSDQDAEEYEDDKPMCCTCVYWKPRDATGEIGTCMEGWEHHYTPYAHSCISWEAF